jgi:hypothetical protein
MLELSLHTDHRMATDSTHLGAPGSVCTLCGSMHLLPPSQKTSERKERISWLAIGQSPSTLWHPDGLTGGDDVNCGSGATRAKPRSCKLRLVAVTSGACHQDPSFASGWLLKFVEGLGRYIWMHMG